MSAQEGTRPTERLLKGVLKHSHHKPLPEGCTHHIMVSYSWRQQTQVSKIKKHLGKVGYRVWMDMDDIEGDVATSKAKAINEAGIVLIAFSEDYAKSEYCKQEAHFALKLKKVIVFLKMEDDEPDDWLGMLLAGYIDFSSTQSLSDKLKQLEVQIDHSLKTGETTMVTGGSMKPLPTERAMSIEGLLEVWNSLLKPLPAGCNHHIMISYSWHQQRQVHKIEQHLTKVGYQVWKKEKEMAMVWGSTRQPGIRKAAIVLIAFSEDYVKSKRCKREALFAHEHKKEIVPLKMTDYNPDNWLGMVLAGKLYIDFSSTQNYSDKLKQLEDQIQHKLAERETK